MRRFFDHVNTTFTTNQPPGRSEQVFAVSGDCTNQGVPVDNIAIDRQDVPV
jgi:hypothetical protein